MCLVKVKEENDIVVPFRRVSVRPPSPRRETRVTRVSKTSFHEQRPASVIRIPTPQTVPIPAPQPVPIFVQPSPPPPPPITRTEAHYVEVSPRSSVTSHSDRRSDYYVHERVERRERRDYSPARSESRGDRSPRYQTYQYIEAPEPERYEPPRRRERSRSRSRGYYDGGSDDVYRTTRERVTVSDGRRSRDYRR